MNSVGNLFTPLFAGGDWTFLTVPDDAWNAGSKSLGISQSVPNWAEKCPRKPLRPNEARVVVQATGQAVIHALSRGSLGFLSKD